MANRRGIAWRAGVVCVAVAAVILWSLVGVRALSGHHQAAGTQGSATSSASADDLAKTGLNLAGNQSVDSAVDALAFTPDGKTLAVRLGTGAVQVRDVGSGVVRSTLGPAGQPGAEIRPSLAVSPDGKDVAIGVNSDKAATQASVDVISVATGKVTASVRTGSFEVYSVAYSPDGKTLAIAAGKEFILWNLVSDTTIEVPTDQGSYIGDSMYVSFSGDGKFIADAGNLGNVRLWDVAATGFTKTLGLDSGNASASTTVNAATISPDGSVVALSGDLSGTDADGNAWANPETWLWYPASGKTALIGTTTPQSAPQNSVSAQAFSPDGKLLATGDGFGTIKLFQTATRTLVSTRHAPSSISAVSALAFEPNGASLVSAQSITATSGQGTAVIQVWGPHPVASPSSASSLSTATATAAPPLPPGFYHVNRQMGITGGWVITLDGVQVAASGVTTFMVTSENTSTVEGQLTCDNAPSSSGATITLSTKQIVNASATYCPSASSASTINIPPQGILEYNTVFKNANGLGQPFSFYWSGPNGFSGSLTDVVLTH